MVEAGDQAALAASKGLLLWDAIAAEGAAHRLPFDADGAHPTILVVVLFAHRLALALGALEREPALAYPLGTGLAEFRLCDADVYGLAGDIALTGEDVSDVGGGGRRSLGGRPTRRALSGHVTLADGYVSHVRGRSGGVRGELRGCGRVAESLAALVAKLLIVVRYVLGLAVRTNGHGDFTPVGGSSIILHRARNP